MYLWHLCIEFSTTTFLFCLQKILKIISSLLAWYLKTLFILLTDFWTIPLLRSPNAGRKLLYSFGYKLLYVLGRLWSSLTVYKKKKESYILKPYKCYVFEHHSNLLQSETFVKQYLFIHAFTQNLSHLSIHLAYWKIWKKNHNAVCSCTTILIIAHCFRCQKYNSDNNELQKVFLFIYNVSCFLYYW